MPRHYYATIAPRGFANEINTYRFTSKGSRDRFVEENQTDSCHTSAHAVTAKEAWWHVRRKSDAVTKVYNSEMIEKGE